MSKKFVLAFINIPRWNLERNCFVWLCSKQQELVVAIWGFLALFKSRHEAVPRLNVGLNVWEIQLKQQTTLAI